MILINHRNFTGSDAILLGAETLRGLYPVETISIVGKICAEVTSHYVSFEVIFLSRSYKILQSFLLVAITKFYCAYLQNFILNSSSHDAIFFQKYNYAT